MDRLPKFQLISNNNHSMKKGFRYDFMGPLNQGIAYESTAYSSAGM